MPCKDTTSQVTIQLDHDDRLTDFDFSKITCSKEIGGATGYKDFCTGKEIAEIVAIEFQDVLNTLNPQETEDQFFLFLEWDALRSGLLQYSGHGEAVDLDRYQVASIEYDEGQVKIIQHIKPPKEMPKIVSCTTRARNASN